MLNALKQTAMGLVLGLTMFSFGVMPIMAQSLLPDAKQQYFNAQGKPVSGGTVDYFIPGGNTRKPVWSTVDKTLVTNPVVLDAAGRPQPTGQTFGDGAYRQIVKDANNNVIWDANTSSTGGGSGGNTATVGDGDAVGTIKSWSGMVVPSQYAFAYGQALVRGTYPELFQALTSQQALTCTTSSATVTGLSNTSQIPIGSPIESTCFSAGSTVVSIASLSSVVISTTAIISTSTTAKFFPYGNGNGTTTFNVPDLRGRTLAGRDNMGNVAAGRLATGNAIGVPLGTETKILVTGNLPPYTPSGSSLWTQTGGNLLLSVANVQGYNSGTAVGAIQNVLGALAGNVQVTGTNSFTGTPQGGNSTPVSVVQPTLVTNYIIKISPDTNPNSYFGVASIGGMYGVITCGLGVTCAGNDISIAGVVVSNIVNNSTSITSGVNQGIAYNNSGIFSTAPTLNNGVVTTNGSGTPIVVATLPAANVPTPTVSTLGGVNSLTCSSSNWINSISTSGLPACGQPSFMDLTSTISSAQIASNTVANSKLTQSAAYTLKGNPTSVTANVQDFTVTSLGLNGSPNASLTTVPCDTGGVLNKCTVGSIAGSVTTGIATIGGSSGPNIGTSADLTVTSATLGLASVTGTGAVVKTASPTLSSPTINGSWITPNSQTIGAGTGTLYLNIDGGNSGAAGGPAIIFKNANSPNNAIGNYSAILGGAYDTTMLFYNVSAAYRFQGIANCGTGITAAQTTGNIGCVPAIANSITNYSGYDCTGVTSSHTAINSALAASVNTISFPPNCTIKISAGVTTTWAAGKSYIMPCGTSLVPDTGVTITIRGAVQANHWCQIFSGAGTITGLKYNRAEWFGAKGDCDSLAPSGIRTCNNNDQPAVQNAINSMQASATSDGGRPTWELKGGAGYGVSTPVVVSPSLAIPARIIGAGTTNGGDGNGGSWIIGKTGLTSAILIVDGQGANSAMNFELKDFGVVAQTIGGPAVCIQYGSAGKYISGVTRSTVENIYTNNCTYGHFLTGLQVRMIDFKRLGAWHDNVTGGVAFYMDASASGSFIGDIDFYSSQFVVPAASGFGFLGQAYNTGVISGVKHWGSTFYQANVKLGLYASSGGQIRDFWCTSCQFDGLDNAGTPAGRNHIYVNADGGSSQVNSLHFHANYHTGVASGYSPLQVLATNSGLIHSVEVSQSNFNYIGASLAIKFSGVQDGRISSNNIEGMNNPGGVAVLIENSIGVSAIGNTITSYPASSLTYFIYLSGTTGNSLACMNSGNNMVASVNVAVSTATGGNNQVGTACFNH